MPQYNFTADYGVELGEHGPADKSGTAGPYAAWAKFDRDRDRDTATGGKVYTFGTDDAAVADRVRAVVGYGITETEPTQDVLAGE